jgi:alpha-tubulin suppressor-like RCC1 family protein
LNKETELWGFGSNEVGGLCSDKSKESINTPEVIMKAKDIFSVNCGATHTVLLKNDGSVYVCGGFK